jgi:pimeloyl-ACP methyl ester carboxylesterase
MKKYLFTTFAFGGLMVHSSQCQTIDTLVDAGGYRLHFHIIKGKGMPILFEAGGEGNGADWDSVFLKPVADITGTTLITYDHPGVGKSELDSSNRDMDKHGILQCIEGLEAGLKKLGYDRNIMLVAHSFGGFCATLYAARHPEKVKSAVMFDINHVCWFIDTYVDSVTTLRRKYWDTAKNKDLASYYQGLNLSNTVALMRKTPFPATIPVIDLVAGNAPPVQVFDSTKEARWRDCHQQFASAEPNRQGITANGCGHFIFRDNPLLAISAIVKAYVGTLWGEQGDEIMKRFLSYSLEAANHKNALR